MELPEEIVAIIKDYARPLKRREISEYWNDKGIFTITEMMAIVKKEMVIQVTAYNEDMHITENTQETTLIDTYYLWIWDGCNFDDETVHALGLTPDYQRRIQYLNDNGFVVHTSDIVTIDVVNGNYSDLYDYTP